MLLQNKQTGDLLEVVDSNSLQDLFNPNKHEIAVKGQQGQEEQAATSLSKNELVFPSGEALPRCWMDVNYRGSTN